MDHDIFLTSMLVGRPRPRSSRLREAIERLPIGSAGQVLADLKRRSATRNNTTKEEISREARRAADVLFAAWKWKLARVFYELAYFGALWDKGEIGRRLMQCRRRSQEVIEDDHEIYGASAANYLDQEPSITQFDLPYVWADLGRLHRCGTYHARASEAAGVVNDQALMDWAKRQAAELRASE